MSFDTDLLDHMTLSEDVRQLAASVERMLTREYNLGRRRRTIGQDSAMDRTFWRSVGELGWFSACVPDKVGGYAETPAGAFALLEQFGRAMVVEPLLSGFIVPVAAVTAAEGEGAARRIQKVASGEEVWALAWDELHDDLDGGQQSVVARRVGSEWRITGRKSAVLAAPLADTLIVSAATEEGPALFAVAPGPGVQLETWSTIGGELAANLILDDVLVPGESLIGDCGDGTKAIRTALDWGAAGACAEAIGAMGAALAATLEYVRTRKQFGQVIGDFQVVQHRLAAMAIELEYARSLLPLLAKLLSGEADAWRQGRISAVRSKIVVAARRVASDAVQLHGGIGVTDEAAISHHFRRIVSLELAWGDARWHLDRYRQTREIGTDLLAARDIEDASSVSDGAPENFLDRTGGER